MICHLPGHVNEKKPSGDALEPVPGKLTVHAAN
jgi:hypothetical protein